jgi:PIN domain nuclease of toxin-antitoxin system
MRYVTDTHALIWYLSGSPRLGSRARFAFDEAVTGESELLIPAIVLAEVIMLAEKNKAGNANEIWTILSQTGSFKFSALSPQTVLKIQALTTLPDIHDRIIVAEAIENQAILITNDGLITASGLVEVVW